MSCWPGPCSKRVDVLLPTGPGHGCAAVVRAAGDCAADVRAGDARAASGADVSWLRLRDAGAAGQAHSPKLNWPDGWRDLALTVALAELESKSVLVVHGPSVWNSETPSDDDDNMTTDTRHILFRNGILCNHCRQSNDAQPPGLHTDWKRQ